jgi:type VI secretion system protein ImpF
MSNNNLLKEPKSFLGSKPLLFDRLINEDINEIYEPSDAVFLSLEKIKASIQTELTRLLNTRAKALDGENDQISYGGPSFYGLPDINKYDVTNSQTWADVSLAIKQSIEHFEPRLRDVKITVDEFDHRSQILHVTIEGKLNIKKIKGEVTFNVAIECSKDK